MDTVECVFCGVQTPEGNAVATRWVSYWDGDEEKGPVCPQCMGRLRFNAESERLELKPPSLHRPPETL